MKLSEQHGIKHSRSQGTIDAAYEFAKAAHGTQLRKYTVDEPYINHPVSVAKIVASVTDDVDMICAALLHDTIEDTKITYSDILPAFGYRCASLVNELTDITVHEDGNRALRKSIEARRLNRVSSLAQTIKLADLIDNSESITRCDTGFARVYIEEKANLLKVLYRGNRDLYHRASEIVIESRKILWP